MLYKHGRIFYTAGGKISQQIVLDEDDVRASVCVNDLFKYEAGE